MIFNLAFQWSHINIFSSNSAARIIELPIDIAVYKCVVQYILEIFNKTNETNYPPFCSYHNSNAFKSIPFGRMYKQLN